MLTASYLSWLVLLTTPGDLQTFTSQLDNGPAEGQKDPHSRRTDHRCAKDAVAHGRERVLNVDNVGFDGADPVFHAIDLCLLSRLRLRKAVDLTADLAIGVLRSILLESRQFSSTAINRTRSAVVILTIEADGGARFEAGRQEFWTSRIKPLKES
ncbi:hypothetical protein CDO29_17375 (plasmid) [Sinorhizobium meliloti]|nr:hypothetical protein CDO29_17375 [Sinorhizobium meliloti]